jgi:hypothetical protein
MLLLVIAVWVIGIPLLVTAGALARATYGNRAASRARGWKLTSGDAAQVIMLRPRSGQSHS